MDKRQSDFRRRHWKLMLGAALLGAILYGPTLLWFLHSLPIGDYDFYAPPAFPLTAVSGGEDLTAERNVILDFSELSFELQYPNRTRVTDSYRLTNPTGDAVAAELALPLFWDPYDHTFAIPAVTLEGTALETSLYLSLDAGLTIDRADNFADIQAAMARTDFLAEARSPAPPLDTPVTVYHIHDFVWPESETSDDLRVGVIYSRGENSTIWKYGTMDMTENEELGIDYMLLHVPTGDTPWVMDKAYLIVEGPDVANIAIQGYRNYEVAADAMVPGVSAQVDRFDSTMGEMIALLAEDYAEYLPHDASRMRARLPADLLYDGAAKRIAGETYHSQAVNVLHSLSELFAEVESQQRLGYQVFSVTVPAGETVIVETQYILPGSEDIPGFAGVASDRVGFELAPTLDSNLHFTGLSATLAGEDAILAFRSQNFGFDPETGVTEVTLDPQTERYYLTIGMP